ncbi:MAG TPA: SRPBCC family protein [Anaerolineales bacterium]
MAKIEKSIFINAPLEKVFAFMAEPNNLPEIWPSLLEVKNVQPLPNGGYCYEWVYKMAGMRFEGQAEWTEFVKNARIVDKNESGIPSTFVWTYQPEDGGTRISVSVEYSLPGAILGKLAEPVIHKMNEHESDTILANLKARMEG